MSIKVGINGFGRIGRQFLRAKLKYDKDDNIDVAAANDLYDSKTLAYLLKYDSIYGILDADIKAGDGYIEVNGKKIKVTSERDPGALPWKELGVDVVLESTGIFRTREGASKHLAAGAKKGGYDSIDEAIPVMTKPPVKTYYPNDKSKSMYDRLYRIYLHCHDHFGREYPQIMKSLKEMKNQVKGGLIE